MIGQFQHFGSITAAKFAIAVGGEVEAVRRAFASCRRDNGAVGDDRGQTVDRLIHCITVRDSVLTNIVL